MEGQHLHLMNDKMPSYLGTGISLESAGLAHLMLRHNCNSNETAEELAYQRQAA